MSGQAESDEQGPVTGNSDRYFEEHRQHEGLARASVNSGLVIVAARGVSVFVQLATTVVLARLLSPHDFGIVALVMALLAFAPILIDLGTTDAATRNMNMSRVESSTLFWLNVAIGGVFTLLFAACSGYIAKIFGEPALVSILFVSSLAFIMTAVPIQHYALMRRAMEFRRIAVIDVAANLISSIIAVAMALAGSGYWALVAKPLIQLAITAVGAWVSCPWLPGPPRITANVKQLVKFGLGVTGFTVTDNIARSADRLALGYFYGVGSLGYFQNAFLLYTNLLNLLTEPLHNVAVSALSKIRSDPDQLKRSWASALSAVSFASAAAFAVLAVTGQDFVVLLLGPKWEPAGPLLCVFAVRGIANSVERTHGWLHVVAGRSDRWMRWGLISSAAQLLALIGGLSFGPIGVAIAYAIIMFGLFLPSIVYSGRPVGIEVSDVVSAVVPQTVAGLLTVAFGLTIQHFCFGEVSQLTRFLVSGFLSLAIYLVLVVGVFSVTGPLKLAFAIAGDFEPLKSLVGTFHAGHHMKSLERFLINLEGWPWSAVWRVALGVIVPPAFRIIFGEQNAIWLSLLLFVVLLAMLRLAPALMRRLLPFSQEAKEVWKQRRFVAKRYDSYQWQKLFWIGLGLLSHEFFGGGLYNGERLVTLICLIGGAAGLYVWRKVSATQGTSLEAKTA